MPYEWPWNPSVIRWKGCRHCELWNGTRCVLMSGDWTTSHGLLSSRSRDQLYDWTCCLTSTKRWFPNLCVIYPARVSYCRTNEILADGDDDVDTVLLCLAERFCMAFMRPVSSVGVLVINWIWCVPFLNALICVISLVKYANRIWSFRSMDRCYVHGREPNGEPSSCRDEASCIVMMIRVTTIDHLLKRPYNRLYVCFSLPKMTAYDVYSHSDYLMINVTGRNLSLSQKYVTFCFHSLVRSLNNVKYSHAAGLQTWVVSDLVDR